MICLNQHAIRLQVVEYLLKPINERHLTELLKRMAIEVMEQQQLDNMSADAEQENGQPLSEHVKMLKDYIHTNYMNDISLSDAAVYLDLHPAYIGQLFKKNHNRLSAISIKSASRKQKNC